MIEIILRRTRSPRPSSATTRLVFHGGTKESSWPRTKEKLPNPGLLPRLWALITKWQRSSHTTRSLRQGYINDAPPRHILSLLPNLDTPTMTEPLGRVAVFWHYGS